MDNATATSPSSPDTASHPRQRRTPRTERPCDICRKRKLKCVREQEQEKCVLCTFHHRECTYLDEPRRRRKRRAEGGEDDGGLGGDAAAGEEALPRKRARPTSARHEAAAAQPAGGVNRSLLDRTLGLHRTTHFKYIGPGSLHEGMLLDVMDASSTRHGDAPGSRFRRVADGTAFISRPDNATLFSSDDEDDIEAIEQIVRPHGPGLVDLYFRTVHPSYPVLHKGVFLEKYARSFREFSPPLLAAVYLLAMDWWEYDEELSSEDKPDGEALVKAATKALTAVVHRPKLSTVQAGLLLLQRSGGDSWVLTSQLVAVAEELGLHVDCTSWNIPAWEKGLRRRLAWATLMQDKWGALIHGRPSHVLSSNWRMPQLSLDDFPESARDQDEKEGSTEVEKGRLLFIHLARLTEIMAEALETLYSHDRTSTEQLLAGGGVHGVLELVKSIAVKLKEWAGGMPFCLRMEDVKTRKLCSNGYLHLSYFVTEMMIYRFVVQTLAREPPQPLLDLCREAARARLERAMDFVEALRPEHLQAFWWFASPRSLAYIRAYGALLWATSKGEEEADFYRRKLEDFRWSLKVRAKGVAFVTVALQEMEESLHDIDMSRPPAVRADPQDSHVKAREGAGSGISLQTLNFEALGGGEDGGEPLDARHAEPILQGAPDFSLADFDGTTPQAFFADMSSQGLF